MLIKYNVPDIEIIIPIHCNKANLSRKNTKANKDVTAAIKNFAKSKEYSQVADAASKKGDRLTYETAKYLGFDNYVKVFTEGQILKYFGNTFLLWLLGFIPQILISLLFDGATDAL